MKVVLQNLTKIFPSRNKKSGEEVVAVNDFSFEIPDGKLIGLLGPSGCGKSTTLYMISGLQKPTSGRIFFGDDDVTELTPENRGIGLVFQNYALYPHMTVQQNIMFPLENLKGKDKLSKEEMLKRTHEVAKLVQIDELMGRKPAELSGGQQQRVAIARALAKMPRVLLLDEPLSNLDARLRLQTREEIRRIQKSTKITTIFVTHDQEEAMSISDYIVVMKQGVLHTTIWESLYRSYRIRPCFRLCLLFPVLNFCLSFRAWNGFLCLSNQGLRQYTVLTVLFRIDPHRRLLKMFWQALR